jgi:hypothetical protein
MHRAVMEACLPSLIALALAFHALVLLVRVASRGCSLRQVMSRLRTLHRCQNGAVQSLSFVLTLPFFIVICMFIVQVSQLMIGVMVVHYAAYAAARSAIVWIPARVDDLAENKLGPPITTDSPLLLTGDGSLVRENFKYRKIFEAAALACAPISPSRDVGFSLDDLSSGSSFVMKELYESLAPASARNTRIPDRIEHKLAYSFQNTAVRISFHDKNTQRGPTYNPRVVVRDPQSGQIVRDGSGQVVRRWDPHEVGWEDPVTVRVTHEFALLPGPGRVLAKYLVRNNDEPDRVAERIETRSTSTRERLYTTKIVAAATLTNEGFKTVIPYEQESY